MIKKIDLTHTGIRRQKAERPLELWSSLQLGVKVLLMSWVVFLTSTYYLVILELVDLHITCEFQCTLSENIRKSLNHCIVLN